MYQTNEKIVKTDPGIQCGKVIFRSINGNLSPGCMYDFFVSNFSYKFKFFLFLILYVFQALPFLVLYDLRRSHPYTGRTWESRRWEHQFLGSDILCNYASLSIEVFHLLDFLIIPSSMLVHKGCPKKRLRLNVKRWWECSANIKNE